MLCESIISQIPLKVIGYIYVLKRHLRTHYSPTNGPTGRVKTALACDPVPCFYHYHNYYFCLRGNDDLIWCSGLPEVEKSHKSCSCTHTVSVQCCHGDGLLSESQDATISTFINGQSDDNLAVAFFFLYKCFHKWPLANPLGAVSYRFRSLSKA